MMKGELRILCVLIELGYGNLTPIKSKIRFGFKRMFSPILDSTDHLPPIDHTALQLTDTKK